MQNRKTPSLHSPDNRDHASVQQIIHSLTLTDINIDLPSDPTQTGQTRNDENWTPASKHKLR